MYQIWVGAGGRWGSNLGALAVLLVVDPYYVLYFENRDFFAVKFAPFEACMQLKHSTCLFGFIHVIRITRIILHGIGFTQFNIRGHIVEIREQVKRLEKG